MVLPGPLLKFGQHTNWWVWSGMWVKQQKVCELVPKATMEAILIINEVQYSQGLPKKKQWLQRMIICDNECFYNKIFQSYLGHSHQLRMAKDYSMVPENGNIWIKNGNICISAILQPCFLNWARVCINIEEKLLFSKINSWYSVKKDL